jgi:ABC-type transport system involved in multi-copper enzyme maturation permease subunit
MSNLFRLRQTWAIARFQLRWVFFSRRSFWVYLLALFPAIIFFAHAAETTIDQKRMSSSITPTAILESISIGTRDYDVVKKAGNPVRDRNYQHRKQQMRHMTYYDGELKWHLRFTNGVLQSKNSQPIINFNDSQMAFAAMFQFYYLRMAIFFGCLGIFMNLFRGEMLDKTLHFWFLIPARREVLLTGKYLAGIIAAVSIFAFGAVLSFALMLWPHHTAQLTVYWQGQGLSHMFSYAFAAALACIGYGSVFLAFGLLLRNPVIPAVVMIFWETINGILPTWLQKLSVLHYVQSLCPVSVPPDNGLPILIRLLMSPADPPSATAAVFGFIIFTALVLLVASQIIRRQEIDYNTE